MLIRGENLFELKDDFNVQTDEEKWEQNDPGN